MRARHGVKSAMFSRPVAVEKKHCQMSHSLKLGWELFRSLFLAERPIGPHTMQQLRSFLVQTACTCKHECHRTHHRDRFGRCRIDWERSSTQIHRPLLRQFHVGGRMEMHASIARESQRLTLRSCSGVLQGNRSRSRRLGALQLLVWLGGTQWNDKALCAFFPPTPSL